MPYPADLSWLGLACTVTDRATLAPKQILAPATGAVVPGEMCAIVGPSGAGKSTLLELLAGQRPIGRVDGAIWMNGRPVGKRFRRVSAFVNQSDMFVPTMSAAETLRFHARLRVPPGGDDIDTRIQAVLETMGLGRARNTQVGGTLPGGITVRGLSGGEKRRLTIACSLIARPSILFLDEPTSGLDSFAALNIMDYVSKLSGLGHTVVASVHQPRSAIWEMFHKVCVLSEGTQLYYGPPAAAAPWFGSLGYRHNPRRDGAVSDWLIDLVSVGFAKPPGWAARSMTTAADVEAAASRWAGRPLPPANDGTDGTLLAAMETAAANAEDVATGKAVAKPRPVSAMPGPNGRLQPPPVVAPTASPPRKRDARFAKYPTGWWTQFFVLLQRAWTQQVRNPADATSRLMLAVWISATAGMIAFDTKLGPSTAGRFVGTNFFEIIVFSLLPFCYMSLYANDRAFFIADVRSGLYRPSAYHAALTAASLPFIILFSVLGGFITYGMVGLRSEAWNLVLFGVLMSLVSMCSIQVLVFFVYLSHTQDMAYMHAVGYSTLGILLMGFWIRIRLIRVHPLRWLSYIFYHRWALAGFSYNELAGRRFFYPAGCQFWPAPHGIAPFNDGGGNAAAFEAAKEPWLTDPANNPFKVPAQYLQPEQLTPSCTELQSGDSILDYWFGSGDAAKKAHIMRTGEVIAILLLFYAAFHVLSFMALRSLVKKR